MDIIQINLGIMDKSYSLVSPPTKKAPCKMQEALYIDNNLLY